MTTAEQEFASYKNLIEKSEDGGALPMLTLINTKGEGVVIITPIFEGQSGASTLTAAHEKLGKDFLPALGEIQRASFLSEIWVRHFSVELGDDVGMDEAALLIVVEAGQPVTTTTQRFVRTREGVTWLDDDEVTEILNDPASMVSGELIPAVAAFVTASDHCPKCGGDATKPATGTRRLIYCHQPFPSLPEV